MKKILITLLFFFSTFTFANALGISGINIGLSGQMGVFHATGEEKEQNETISEDATGLAGYGSIFVEKTLGDRFVIGIDYVPTALESETTEIVVDDIKAAADGASSQQTNKVQVDFEDLTTIYIGARITDSMYIKAGLVQVDIITNESLGTGSTYNNTDMDGTMFGLGFNNEFGNSAFYRIEGTYMDFGSASVTASNTDNKVSLKDLQGATAKISIGKSF